ncbi:hypothetical protein ACFUN8_33015 [Streptomyces sp. NPDC057307]|uniref:hypothetical protein n=1 Tax=Streptomyces sp. NPDC057307 TaxID=3346096 RepID=UPI0036258301
MKKARNFLLLLLLAALTIQALSMALLPLVPYIVSALAIVLVMGFVYYKMTRW